MNTCVPQQRFSWSGGGGGGGVHLAMRQNRTATSRLSGREFTDRAVAAIAESKRRGFRTIITATLFNTPQPEERLRRLDDVMAMGVDASPSRPGYATNAPLTQQISSIAPRQGNGFADIFPAGSGHLQKNWSFYQVIDFPDCWTGQSDLTDALGHPTRTYFRLGSGRASAGKATRASRSGN